MRCNDCNKFVSLDPGDPQAEGFNVEDKCVVKGTIQISGNCSECSTELLSHEFEIEVILNAEQQDTLKEHCCSPEIEETLSNDATTITRKRYSDTQKDKEGNPKELKPEQLDGFNVTGSIAIKCEKGDELFVLDIDESIAQNEMDEQ